MNVEIWKDIKDYEGLYQVSNLGMIRSLDHYTKTRGVGLRLSKGRLLSQGISKKGYAVVVLCKNGITKNYRVNRLVAEAFIPNPDNLPYVNHKNEIKTDNRVENLEWCTPEYNINYGDCINKIVKKNIGKLVNRKDLSKPVEQYTLDGVFVAEYPSLREASRQTGINAETIRRCCLGKNYTAGRYVWKYKD